MLQDEYKFKLTDENGWNIEQFIIDFRKGSTDEKEMAYFFTHGYCYHFACILAQLFDGEIVYNPVDNHFGFSDAATHCVWDITGALPYDAPWYKWEAYKEIEPIESKRIIEQCVYKIYIG